MPKETAAQRAERERMEPPKDWAEQNVHSALVRVMRDLPVVGKDRRNEESPEQFMFRGIDAVLNAAGPLFRKHGVQVMPETLEADLRSIQVDRGEATVAKVRVRYTFYGPDGSERSAVVPGEAIDTGDKALNKAMSVALRTALIHALAIPTGDPDPDASTYRQTGGGQQRQGAAQSAGGQRQQRPGQGDPRQPLWDEIAAIGRKQGRTTDDIRRMFARWSGGKQIDGKGVTEEILCRFRDEEMNAPEPPDDYQPSEPHDSSAGQTPEEAAAVAALRAGLGAEPLPEGAGQ